MDIPNFDADFLKVNKAVGRAAAFPTAPDGEYEMISVESTLVDSKSTEGVKNWKISFSFPEYSDEFNEFGKTRFSRWIPVTPQFFPQIADMYEALYGEDWPEEGLDKDEFLAMVANGTGKTCNVVLEEAPHHLADSDPDNFGELRQNNIISVTNPKRDAEDFEASFDPSVFGDSSQKPPF